MPHTLLHIYGPIALHSYGFMIAIGLLAFIYLIRRDPRFRSLNLESHLIPAIMIGIVAGILGGRALFFATHPELFRQFTDLFSFWEGGFSILGSVIAIACTIPAYLWYYQIPMVRALDIIATYAPLLQSISRIGCFFAGCCFGVPTTKPWAIVYTDTGSIAPLYVCLHPTQLYSAALLLLIFSFMYFIGRTWLKKPGQQACTYFFAMALERFMVDFWRGDRLVNEVGLSLNQQVALGMMAIGIIGFGISSLIRTNYERI